MERRPSQVLDPVLDPALHADFKAIEQRVLTEQAAPIVPELPAARIVTSTIYGTKGGLHQVGETHRETVDSSVERRRLSVGQALGVAVLAAESYADPSQRGAIKEIVDRQAAQAKADEMNRLGRERDEDEKKRARASSVAS